MRRLQSQEIVIGAIDLFAGPGGWDVAARSLGVEALGIERDPAACATRRASGLLTIEDDVRRHAWSLVLSYAATCGLIASPPCQTFSPAGNGMGRRDLHIVLDLVRRMALRDRSLDLSVFDDERTGLVLEPLYWALLAIDLGRPFPWLAFEQVPAVLPVWEAMAAVLRAEGYSVVTGKLSAEQYGVPQTRVRAFLVARRDGTARLPAPTHRPYRKGVAQHEGDPMLLPWASMAEALGWDEPRIVVSNYGTGGDPTNRGERTSAEPAATVTGKIDRNRVHRAGSTKWCRISPEEAAALQAFPPEHAWQGTKTQKYQQIGNAVPPTLSRAVLASAMLREEV